MKSLLFLFDPSLVEYLKCVKAFFHLLEIYQIAGHVLDGDFERNFKRYSEWDSEWDPEGKFKGGLLLIFFGGL